MTVYAKNNRNFKAAVRKLNYILLQQIKTFNQLSIYKNYWFILKDLKRAAQLKTSKEKLLKKNLKIH